MEEPAERNPRPYVKYVRFFAYSAFITAFIPLFAFISIETDFFYHVLQGTAANEVGDIMYELWALFLAYSIIAGIIASLILGIKKTKGRLYAFGSIALNIIFTLSEWMYFLSNFTGCCGAP